MFNNIFYEYLNTFTVLQIARQTWNNIFRNKFLTINLIYNVVLFPVLI